jgi:carbonic anhydrase/acetyltransferase-like protein (isoleucine patch superfamily)
MVPDGGVALGIYEFEGNIPTIGEGSFIHPEATIIGNVTLGEGCYVGAGARIRGDWGRIVIGRESNIQENCVIHVGIQETAQLGPRSHIGHGAILHSCTFGEHVFVGMGSIIMNGSDIGEGCCIGSGALVTENRVIPPYKLVVGVPGKIIGDVSEEMKKTLEEGTAYYIGLSTRCKQGLREISLNAGE